MEKNIIDLMRVLETMGFKDVKILKPDSLKNNKTQSNELKELEKIFSNLPNGIGGIVGNIGDTSKNNQKNELSSIFKDFIENFAKITEARKGKVDFAEAINEAKKIKEEKIKSCKQNYMKVLNEDGTIDTKTAIYKLTLNKIDPCRNILKAVNEELDKIIKLLLEIKHNPNNNFYTFLNESVLKVKFEGKEVSKRIYDLELLAYVFHINKFLNKIKEKEFLDFNDKCLLGTLYFEFEKLATKYLEGKKNPYEYDYIKKELEKVNLNNINSGFTIFESKAKTDRKIKIYIKNKAIYLENKNLFFKSLSFPLKVNLSCDL